MKLEIKTEHYALTLESDVRASDPNIDLGDTFSRMAYIIELLEKAAKESGPIVVDKLTSN